MVTNKEAIKALRDIAKYYSYITPNKELTALKMAIKALEASAWIPVGERLPDETDIYLITFGKYETARAVIASHYFDGEWLSLDHGYVFGTVKAWMPLPEPYKGGEDND